METEREREGARGEREAGGDRERERGKETERKLNRNRVTWTRMDGDSAYFDFL